VEDWDQGRIDAAIAAVEKSGSSEEKLAAARTLLEIPPGRVPETFASMKVVEGRLLTLPARLLLIRWASSDGEAAAEASWLRLREDGMWTEAWRQIGPAWAWHDPKGLARWIQERLADQPQSSASMSHEEVLAKPFPVVTGEHVSMACVALCREDPFSAFSIFLKNGFSMVTGNEMCTSMKSPRLIQQALSACGPPEELEKVKIRHDNPAQLFDSLLQRWNEIDPDGLAASEYARYFRPDPRQQLKRYHETWADLPPEGRAGAANRLLAGATGDRTNAVSETVRAWAKVDPDACREWMDSLPDELAGTASISMAQVMPASEIERTMGWVDQLPSKVREPSVGAVLSSWRRTFPDTDPDMSQWSDERRESWKDFDALDKVMRR
jgi:hypothetical protein